MTTRSTHLVPPQPSLLPLPVRRERAGVRVRRDRRRPIQSPSPRSAHARATLSPRPRPRPRPRAGTILIVTMAILFILAAFVLVFARAMRVEAIASANAAAAAQASAVERGAEQYCIAMLMAQTPKDSVFELDDTNYTAIPVGPDDAPTGYFWLLCPDYDDPSLPFYGFVAESAKLNLNGVLGGTPAVSSTTILSMFEGLPGVTPDMAAALVDWRDADDTPTAADGTGAESDYYLSLPNPYHAKNSNFEAVEEVLLVRGFNKQLLYGTLGAPSSSAAQQQQQQGGLASGNLMATNNLVTDRALALGINDLLTVYSKESVPTQNGGGGGDGGGGGRGGGGGGGGTTNTTVRGRININRAPAEVLMCLPGLDQNDVSTIQAKRTGLSTPDDLSWVSQALAAGKYDAIRNLITGTTNQFSADLVAVAANGRAFRRVKIVFDGTSASNPPTILYRRDITDQGWPLDPEILTSLRQGAGLPSSAYLPPPRRLPQ